MCIFLHTCPGGHDGLRTVLRPFHPEPLGSLFSFLCLFVQTSVYCVKPYVVGRTWPLCWMLGFPQEVRGQASCFLELEVQRRQGNKSKSKSTQVGVQIRKKISELHNAAEEKVASEGISQGKPEGLASQR